MSDKYVDYVYKLQDLMKAKSELTKDKQSLIRGASAEETRLIGLEQPMPKKLFGSLWYTDSMAILFGDTGIGKSFLAFQIAVGIARGEKEICGLINETEAQPVVYCDFEMPIVLFAQRYKDFQLPPNLFRVEMSKDTESDLAGEQHVNLLIINIIEYCKEKNSKILVIDNLNEFAEYDITKGHNALRLSKMMHSFVNEGITILILSHTPKLLTNNGQALPLTKNNLAGSKKLSDSADSIIAFGKVATNNEQCYIKHLKGRFGKEKDLDDYNVLLVNYAKVFEKENGLQGFTVEGIVSEKSLLVEPDDKNTKLTNDIKDLQSQGKTQKQIALELGINQSTVSRTLSK